MFVVEQACAYLDADGWDPRAWHLLGWSERAGEATLDAYSRIFAPAVKYAEASIGRIITHPRVRGSGLGRILVHEGIRRVGAAWGPVPIRIAAQERLERFYEELGFRRVSETFDEDGIPHVEMLRPA